MNKICFMAFFISFILMLFSCESLNGEENNGNNNNGNGSEININEILLEFYEKHQLLGGISLAISRNDKIVYTGSVGYADQNNSVNLTPEHRMRIASVSKPITSTAVMKLQREGKINLDDAVFGIGSIFNNSYGMPSYNSNPVEITVRQLLEHTSGGWADVTGRTNISQAILNHPLEYLPGTQYVYSNFGYYILGRVIEKITGMTYENYVKENILLPSGVNGMRVGATQSGADEVKYIATLGDSVTNPSTYNNPATMDSFGGWVASPTELIKLMINVDGWNIDKTYNNWTHNGSMPGTYTIIRKNANFYFAMFMNYRPPSPRTAFDNDRTEMFSQIINIINEWSK